MFHVGLLFFSPSSAEIAANICSPIVKVLSFILHIEQVHTVLFLPVSNSCWGLEYSTICPFDQQVKPFWIALASSAIQRILFHSDILIIASQALALTCSTFIFTSLMSTFSAMGIASHFFFDNFFALNAAWTSSFYYLLTLFPPNLNSLEVTPSPFSPLLLNISGSTSTICGHCQFLWISLCYVQCSLLLKGTQERVTCTLQNVCYGWHVCVQKARGHASKIWSLALPEALNALAHGTLRV